MSGRRLVLVAVALLSVLGAVWLSSGVLAQDRTADEELRYADKMFAEYSFGQARDAYTRYLTATAPKKEETLSAVTRERRAHALNNLAVAQFKTKFYDKAFVSWEMLCSTPGVTATYREAEARYAMAQGRLVMPGYYTQKPAVASDATKEEKEAAKANPKAWGRWVQQGVYHNVAQENYRDAVRNLERAERILFHLEAASPSARNLALLQAVRFDLAGSLPELERWDGFVQKTYHRKLEDGREWSWQARVPTFPHQGRIIQLYQRIERDAPVLAERQKNLSVAQRQETRWQGAKARFRLGVYFMHCAEQSLNYDPFALEFPGSFPSEADPLPVWRSVVKRYPKSRRAPEALLAIARCLNRMGHFSKALDVLAELARGYGTSRFMHDAARLAQYIKAPQLSMNNRWAVSRVGKDATLNFTGRNVKQIEVTTHEFKLGGFFNDNRWLQSPSMVLRQLGTVPLDLLRAYRGQELRRFTLETGDDGSHQWLRSKPIPTQLKKSGAYLITATGGGHTVTALRLVTDLGIIEKSAPDINLYWTASSETSKPVGQTRLIHKEYYYANGRSWTEVRRSTTDERGIREQSRPRSVPGRYYQGTITFAQSPDGRVTLTNRVRLDYWFQDRGTHIKLLTQTDRPVYRPGQTVSFKTIARRYAAGRFDPISDLVFHYTISNPRGEKVKEGDVTSNEFGTLADSLTLPAKPPLGTWRVRVETRGVRRQEGVNCYFKVEEYKKPEYEVTVEGPSEVVRLGSKVTAKVKVEYYSGGAVAGAKVKVRVFQKPAAHSYRFPRPWDWYFGDYLYPSSRYGGWWGDGNLVKEIEAEADESGMVPIAFDTLPYVGQGDLQQFTIKVEATDESRRVIEGQGAVLVSKTGFKAFLDLGSLAASRASDWPIRRDWRRQVFRPGDNMEFELYTETPNKKPVASTGKLHVYKISYKLKKIELPGGVREVLERKEVEIAALDAKTVTGTGFASMMEGRGFVPYTIPKDVAGEFVARYVTMDQWENEITAERQFWVANDNYQGRETRFSNFRIIPDKRVYLEGETARILITSAKKDVHFLYAVESGVDRVKHELKHTPGSAMVLEIPITEAHVPNFFVDVISIMDGVSQEQRIELFVPPAKRFLNVTLTADKEEYLPGTAGQVTATVSGPDNKPVLAEIALGVVDSSVFYIAPDRTPDPRLYFYKYRRTARYQVYTSLQFTSWARTDNANRYRRYDQGVGRPFNWSYSSGGYFRQNIRRRIGRIDTKRLDLGKIPAEPSEVIPEFPGGRVPRGRPVGSLPSDGGNRFPNAMPSPPPFPKDESDTPGPDGQKPSSLLPSEGIGAGSGPGGAGGMVYRRARGGGWQRDRNGAAADGAEMQDAAPSSGRPASARAQKSSEDKFVEQLQKKPAGGFAMPPAPGAGSAPVQVRRAFKDTALWAPHLTTSAKNGVAKATVKFPDNLTRWQMTALVVDAQGRVGYAKASTRTNKRVIARLQAPRFFTERDEVVLSAVVQNDLKQDAKMLISIAIDAAFLAPLEGTKLTVERDVKSGGRTRVDWRVRVMQTGMVTIRMTARTDIESDAQEQSFPVYAHGIMKHVIETAVIRPHDADANGDADTKIATRQLSFTIPAARNPAQTSLRVTVEPTLLNVTLQALPYLIEYPYRSIDSVVNRFVPAVITRQTLNTLGLDLAAIRDSRRKRKVEDLPANVLASYKSSPVFEDDALDALIDYCRTRLYNAQNGDGGFPWWPGGPSDPYMTAYVIEALTQAREAKVAIDDGVFTRACNYLAARYEKQMDLHRAAYYAYVLVSSKKVDEKAIAPYVELVYKKRDFLTHTGRALLTLIEHGLGHKDKAAVLARNLTGYARHNDESDTWYWELPGTGWWLWYRDRNETHAWVMRALNTVAPDDPKLPGLAKFIVNNRQGTRWRSTKATAYSVLALTQYAEKHGELDADYRATITLDGKPLRTFTITRENLFVQNPDVFVDAEALTSGKHTITVTRTGIGAAYITAHVAYFTKEEPITAAHNEIEVVRTYTRLTPRVEGKGIAKRLVYDRAPLKQGEKLESGTLLEVALAITAPNDYEYVAIEDFKAAGVETVDRISGVRWDGGLLYNRELRDEKVVFFITHLIQGTVTLRYRVRAEIPGTFHALPSRAWAMYAPDVRANANEKLLTITDAK